MLRSLDDYKLQQLVFSQAGAPFTTQQAAPRPTRVNTPGIGLPRSPRESCISRSSLGGLICRQGEPHHRVEVDHLWAGQFPLGRGQHHPDEADKVRSRTVGCEHCVGVSPLNTFELGNSLECGVSQQGGRDLEVLIVRVEVGEVLTARRGRPY